MLLHGCEYCNRCECRLCCWQEFVKQARENSAQYRQKLVEWEKRVLAEGHPELVRRVNVKKKTAARVSTKRRKTKPAATVGRPKKAAAKAKPRAKKASKRTGSVASTSKVAQPKKVTSCKKGRAVEE